MSLAEAITRIARLGDLTLGAATIVALVGYAPVATAVSGDSLGCLSDKITITPSYGEMAGSPYFLIAHRLLEKPKVGLALSGGGARSLAQIGVLLALEENDIPIDFIAGTSMGAIIGGLYAAGYSASQLRDLMLSLDWSNIFSDAYSRKNLLLSQKQKFDRPYLQLRFDGLTPKLPQALTAGQKMQSVLTDLTLRAKYWSNASFDELRIPFRAIATDIITGREIVLAQGDLAEAMRASAAVPLLFAPVWRDTMLLADGGLVDNLPVDVVRRHGMRVVIAVDATSNLRSREELDSPFALVDQMSTIMQLDRNNEQKQSADVLLSLAEESRNSTDFTQLDSLIRRGYELAMQNMAAIRSRCHTTTNSSSVNDSATFHFSHVKIVGAENALQHVAAIESRLLANNGAGMTLAALREQLNAIYASGDYQELVATPRHDTVMVRVKLNTIINRVEFHGNTIYADSTLRALMVTPAHRRLNHHRGKQDLENILEHYRRDGYPLARIKDVAMDSSKTLHVTINEGYISGISIQGLRHTRATLVTSNFSIKKGGIFNSAIARTGIENVYSTGLFDKVNLALIRQNDNSAQLIIKVQEKPHTVVRVGGYWNNERGIRGLLEIGDENVLGSGSRLFLQGNAGDRDRGIGLSWHNDWIVRKFLTLSAGIYWKESEIFTYRGGSQHPIGEFQENRRGAHLLLGQNVKRFGAVTAELRSEDVSLRPRFGFGYPVGSNVLTSLRLSSVVDTRDQVPFTRSGRYFQIFYQQYKPITHDKTAFFKFQAHLESFWSFGPHTAHTRFIGATSDQITPFSERFRLGGPDFIYGLHDQELIGRHVLLGSVEYRYQLRKRPWFDTYLSLRYDFGSVWDELRATEDERPHHSAGFALDVDTPIGAIGAAIGFFELDRRTIYLHIGQSF